MTAVVRARTGPIPGIGPTAAALAVGTLIATASTDDGVVLCPFRRCTGGYCPGCGATRAANRLVHGDVAASWAQHPWVVLAAIQTVVLGGAVGAALASGRRDIVRARWRPAALAVLVANTVLLLVIWGVRLQGGAIPTGLF